ncbi:hypothetical protein RN001_002738 [Aquatica leii]|uniref:Uncharacterized protein n=1 Tax=Aquatica leii TaxID=1421715 RepID=A0AAN7PHA8_9COLE|nr:hypothetical protein RN001_002738 [Aquatica leii]
MEITIVLHVSVTVMVIVFQSCSASVLYFLYTSLRFFTMLSGNDVLARYNKKIILINNVDSYTLWDKDLQFDTQSFLPVTSKDIVSYLVLTHSFYTGEQIYKSLLGYKYFESGFIQMIGT